MTEPRASDSTKHIAIVFAGGKALRFGNDATPKQYQTLLDRPVISHVLKAIAASSLVREVVIGADTKWHEFLRQEMARNDELSKLLVTLVPGGSSAHRTRLHCLEAIAAKTRSNPIIILIDGARPLVRARDVDAAVIAAQENGSAVAVKAATETIVFRNRGELEALPRSCLLVAAAPQAAYLDRCLQLHQDASDTEEPDRTLDLCSLLLSAGETPAFFYTSPENIKITYESDLAFASEILRRWIS